MRRCSVRWHASWPSCPTHPKGARLGLNLDCMGANRALGHNSGWGSSDKPWQHAVSGCHAETWDYEHWQAGGHEAVRLPWITTRGIFTPWEIPPQTIKDPPPPNLSTSRTQASEYRSPRRRYTRCRLSDRWSENRDSSLNITRRQSASRNRFGAWAHSHCMRRWRRLGVRFGPT